MLHCHLGCTAWARVSVFSNVELGEHVVREFAAASPQAYHDRLLFSGEVLVQFIQSNSEYYTSKCKSYHVEVAFNLCPFL